MPTFRCTRAVLDRFRLKPEADLPPPEGRLGDWYVHQFSVGRQRLLLCVSGVSLLPVVMPARKAEFPGKFPAYLNEVLLALGVPEEEAREEAFRGWPSAEGGARIGKTDNRSVVGVMGDFIDMARRAGGPGDLLVLSLWLARTPSSPIRNSPDRKTRELFGLSTEGTAWRPSSAIHGGVGSPPGGGSAPAPPPPPPVERLDETLFFPGSRGRGPTPEAPGFLEMMVLVQETEPPIWRLIQVSEAATLNQLHRILQVAMGWADVHLHHFEIRGERYGDPGDGADDWGPPEKDDTRIRLVDLELEEGERFRYAYDYGDDWQLLIQLSHRVVPLDPYEVSWIVAGERAGPPESCGGAPGLAELMELLADPSHPEHGNARNWAGDAYDPAHFNRDLTNNFLELAAGWGAIR